MITKMAVFSSNPSAPELPLGGFMPNDDPVNVRGITGLGPVKADITTTKQANGRGTLLQGTAVTERNIVMTLGFNPDWATQSISTLRQLLYSYFMTEEWCKLRFFSDHLPNVDIEGYVESFEPNMFSQDPEVQISVICPQPDFIEPDATLYFGTIDDGTTEFEFEYNGTLPTGFELRVDRTVENPSYTGEIEVTLKSPERAQIFTVDPATIDTTQYFKLSTVHNNKRVQTIDLTDASVSNLLAYMDNNSVWGQLKNGTNLLSVAAAENGQRWTLAYFNRYGGL